MAEPELESIRSVQLTYDKRMAEVCLWMFAITPLWITIQDTTGQPPETIRLWWTMRAVLVGIPLLGLVAVRRAPDHESYRNTAFVVSLLIAASIIANSLVRPETEAVPLRGRIMAPALMYLLLPNTLKRQIAAPVLLSAAGAAIRLLRLQELPWSMFAADVFIVLMLNAAGILMVQRRRQLENSIQDLWQRAFASRAAESRAVADLAVLRGIIPICSYCRRVRSEVGDWQKVENYVSAHYNADFSHGVCPQCRTEHFPQFKPKPT